MQSQFHIWENDGLTDRGIEILSLGPFIMHVPPPREDFPTYLYFEAYTGLSG